MDARQGDFDVVFLGIELAAENSKKKSGETSATRIAGQAGAIIFGQYVKESPLLAPVLRELGTVSGFDDETRADITANHQVYTQQKRVLQVRGHERFPTGAIRHPRFVCWRDDKSHVDCVWREDEG